MRWGGFKEFHLTKNIEENVEKAEEIDETAEKSLDFNEMSDEEFDGYSSKFFGEEIVNLSQAEVDARLLPILAEKARRGQMVGFFLELPSTVTAEEIQSRNSSWAKVYRSLFNLSSTKEYRQNPELQVVVDDLENLIGQNPQMIGSVAMWNIAKDIMWRRDISSTYKSSLIGSMTYALAFSNTEKYEIELLNNLDFTNLENYTEVAHMLEALKQFWSAGFEAYAEDTVPDFYLRALGKVEDTPEANYLLSIRAREILSLLEQSDFFVSEGRDLKPFKLSKDVYVSTQINEGIMVVPEESNKELEDTIENFDNNEELITPPQWMIDEAVARGDTEVIWQPPRHLISARRQLFNEMHRYATVPIAEKIGELGNFDEETKQNMVFDYEYLVSKPIRTIIQRELAFELGDLLIREQFYFLNYLKKTTNAEVETMKNFTSVYGIEGMRTFLSLEKEKDFGDKIVAFGANNEEAGEIFSYYSTILDTADKAEKLTREALAKQDLSEEEKNQYIEAVRERVKEKADQTLKRAIEAGRVDDVLAEIQNMSLETAGVGVTYAELLQAGLVSKIEDLDSISSKRYAGQEVLENPTLMAMMEDLYRENYSAENAEGLITDLKQFLGEEGASVQILAMEGKALSSVMLVDRGETTYVGALNTSRDPENKELRLGTHMIDEVIDAQSERVLEAVATIDNARSYINAYDFIATGIDSRNPLLFSVQRNKDGFKLAKNLKQSEIIRGEIKDKNISILKIPKEQIEELSIPEGQGISRIVAQREEYIFVCEPLEVREEQMAA